MRTQTAIKTPSRRLPPDLNCTLYSYVEKGNRKHAKTVGKSLFGSHSAYINALIAKDRGVTPKLGAHRPKGETEMNRKATKK